MMNVLPILFHALLPIASQPRLKPRHAYGIKPCNKLSRSTLLFLLGLVLPVAAQADFELADPSGRRLLLKDNGTWEYVDAKGEGTGGKSTEKGEAVLRLESMADIGPYCRMSVHLTNNLPYQIRDLVLYFAAYRADGVAFETVSPGNSFNTMSPGAAQRREFQFYNVNCKDIARVQIFGADRCNMGDLTKYSAEKGQCLARVRVVESDLVRFEK